jgi:hypothetical protein
MEEATSDDEVRWNLESSGDEGGAAAEAPAVVLPKPKKPRSKAQLAAFEKARATRAANILRKKEAKSAPAPEPVEQPTPKTRKAKKQRVVYEAPSDDESSSSDEDVLLVRRRKKPKQKPVKKTKRPRAKPRILYESDLDSSSGDERPPSSASKVSVPQLPQFYVM